MIYSDMILSNIFGAIQLQLIPALQDELGELTDKDRQFVEVVALISSHANPLLSRYSWCGVGRKPKERTWILHSFIAKAVYNFPTNRALIDTLKTRPTLRRLCGYEFSSQVPDEATFSRAFADFSNDQLGQKIHDAMIQTHLGRDTQVIVGHISRDATAIEGREKPAAKPPIPAESAPKRKPGRPAKGQEAPPKTPTRLEKQVNRTLKENLADLPSQCDIGCKANSKGHTEYWIGYKLSLDTSDHGIPISAVLTSASVHDSQMAIPLVQQTHNKVCHLYDLMDSAYDCPLIKQFIQDLGHVPIIDPNRRRGPAVELDPAKELRYKGRTVAERANSELKDNYGGRFVRVRGAVKVMGHLMFGILALTAVKLLHLVA